MLDVSIALVIKRRNELANTKRNTKSYQHIKYPSNTYRWECVGEIKKGHDSIPILIIKVTIDPATGIQDKKMSVKCLLAIKPLC